MKQILIIGEIGTGKTVAIRAIAKNVGGRFIIYDAKNELNTAGDLVVTWSTTAEILSWLNNPLDRRNLVIQHGDDAAGLLELTVKMVRREGYKDRDEKITLIADNFSDLGKLPYLIDLVGRAHPFDIILADSQNSIDRVYSTREQEPLKCAERIECSHGSFYGGECILGPLTSHYLSMQ